MCYNVDADTNGSGGVGTLENTTSLTTVLQAIGQASLAGNKQPPDVLAFEELSYVSSGYSPTLPIIVSCLDAAYPGSNYTYDPTYDPTDGNDSGNGPSGLIYNANTVKDLGAVAIGSVGGSGAARAPMRYDLEPVGGSSSSQFYLYVEHAKSGSSSSDVSRRNVEAQEVRSDSANLGANANVMYVGDFNGSPGEAYYTTLTASGVGQAFDPGYSSNWYTESATSLAYRDDYQFSTGPVYNGTGGLKLVQSSYTVFGNNGSTNNSGNVTQSGNTALTSLGLSSSASATVLSALTTTTDHLPVVADYSFTPASTPATISLGSVVNARVMSGVAGTLGTTIMNSAASGANNLNYMLAAAVTSGIATLGTVTPGSGALASGANQANTVSATSTNLGLNTIAFTASDPNASNTPQTIDATLTVVANRVVTATPVSFGILHVGQTPAGSYSTTLSTTGDNNHYTAVTVPGGSNAPVTVAGTSTVFNANNQSEVRTVTAGAFNTAGLINNTVSLATVGEGLAGEQPIPVQVSYSATVFSGSASWTGASGSSWGTNGNWQDTLGTGVQAAPGTFTGYSDTAVLDDSATGSRNITLDGVSPTLSSLTFNTPSGNGYSIGPGTGGTLQFSSTAGAATLSVLAGRHSISAAVAFAGSGAITLNPSTQLTVSSNIGGSVTIANSGTFELAGGTAASVTQITGGGALQLDAGSQLSLTGLNGVLGYQGTSVNSVPSAFSVLSSLAIAGTTNAWTGDLNIGYGGFVLTNATTAEVAMVSNMIAEGADKGKWDGTEGITSSDATANPNNVGIASMYVTSGSYKGDLIVAAELAGDVNMDGTVNSKDLAIVNSNWLGSPSNGVTNWQIGDLNYDGTVNSKDLALVNGNWLSSSMPLVAFGPSPSSIAGGAEAVPEPGTLALLAAGLIMTLGAALRRRARNITG